MKNTMSFKRIAPLLAILALVAAWQIMPASAEQKAKGASTSAKNSGMTEYLIISPHTPDQCLASLDAVEAMPNGKAELAKWNWGCKSGDHTGYLMVKAASVEDAQKYIPEAERANAKIVKLNKFTEEEIKSFHAASK